jgi:hypothetical protein
MSDNTIEIESLKRLSASLKKEISEIRRELSVSAQASSAELSAFEKRVSGLETFKSKVRSIEDIPGPRTPRWYVVDIDFSFNATAPSSGSVEISPDGPFICTQIQPYYFVTDTDYTHYQGVLTNPNPDATPLAQGRYLPCTASSILSSNVHNLGVYGAVGAPGPSDVAGTEPKGPLRDFPEFSFKIQTAGSGTFWTQDKYVPASAFYGISDPLYLGVQGFVERTDRIVVYANPETAVPLDGRVRMVFHGFQILGHVDVAEMLGY